MYFVCIAPLAAPRFRASMFTRSTRNTRGSGRFARWRLDAHAASRVCYRVGPNGAGESPNALVVP